MLNLFRKRKMSKKDPPEEMKEEVCEEKVTKNTDEIEKNVEEPKVEEEMEKKQEEDVKVEEMGSQDTNDAINEPEGNATQDITPDEELKKPENAEEKFIGIAHNFAQERGLEDSAVEEGMKALKQIRDGWLAGELTTDMLALVMRGLEYDKAVKEAREAGEIAGRNTQIEEKYMRPIESDGLPYLAGASVRKNPAKISSIFELARNA